ncbi:MULTISPECIES: hypothetical protein [Pseudomonas]|uniref:HeH/LEM domain-containing protein n=2 Tax=Pseudomonas monteilii TaxID=76759 RepID=A0A7X3F147_9PSED|nr:MULTISPECIES: hypothetical protein [Pseudomonas]AHC85730.1 hypothetical protein X969_11380 [Pseudomonas monteilii SB3078]AHC91090.1 hypothetical protein X970_11035 [Pseudomonas monteilii SB3101]KAF4559200.1 hypothetical protein HBJ16_003202 [Pseudomonas sp. CES]MVF49411.1 hypothetical protein [Pseudomonas monteilii]
MSEKVIYEPHPVTAERKAELRQKGYKIIDATFAPEGYEHPEPVKEAKAGKTGKSAAEKKVAAEAELKEKLQAALTEKGIQFPPEASIPDLQKLLDEAA